MKLLQALGTDNEHESIMKPFGFFTCLAACLLLACQGRKEINATTPIHETRWSTTVRGETVAQEYTGNLLDGEVRIYTNTGELKFVSHWQQGIKQGHEWKMEPTQSGDCVIQSEWIQGKQIPLIDSSEECIQSSPAVILKGIVNKVTQVAEERLDTLFAQKSERIADTLASAFKKYAPPDACAECVKQMSRGLMQGARASFVGYWTMVKDMGEGSWILATDSSLIPRMNSAMKASLDSLSHVDWKAVAQASPAWMTEAIEEERDELHEHAGPIPESMFYWYLGGYAIGYTTIEALPWTQAKPNDIQHMKPSARNRLAARQSKHRAFLDFRAHRTPHNRLPEHEGSWQGAPGNSLWRSDIEDVNTVTRGKGIPFYNGKPDFSAWSQGGYVFREGELNGTEQDFEAVYKRIAQKRGCSPSQAHQWLRHEGLTPHHVDERQIQLIPTALHANVPHTGGAALLRAEAR